ncbi:hypothetical protein PAXINDRAFT_166929 [Paxillus involutus ATCC 200175]|nr:hypothetical protein PAXINDRAFT_166929 [Paxillus involutus ATCC 200175]
MPTFAAPWSEALLSHCTEGLCHHSLATVPVHTMGMEEARTMPSRCLHRRTSGLGRYTVVFPPEEHLEKVNMAYLHVIVRHCLGSLKDFLVVQ